MTKNKILTVSPLWVLINYNEENSNIKVEKPGRYHFNQVIKINITRKGTHAYYVPSEMMYRDG